MQCLVLWQWLLGNRQELRQTLEKDLQQGGQGLNDLAPEAKSEAISFLVDIGRWATSELKEKWRLARLKKDIRQTTQVDFSKSKEEVEQQSEILLQDMIADYGAAEVERVLRFIKRKRGLILEWKESKVDNEEEFSRQTITRATLRLRQQELAQKIVNTLAEIEADLTKLGVQVKKERVV